MQDTRQITVILEVPEVAVNDWPGGLDAYVGGCMANDACRAMIMEVHPERMIEDSEDSATVGTRKVTLDDLTSDEREAFGHQFRDELPAGDSIKSMAEYLRDSASKFYEVGDLYGSADTLVFRIHDADRGETFSVSVVGPQRI